MGLLFWRRRLVYLLLDLYTDGSSTGKVGEGGWAYVLLQPGMSPEMIEDYGGEDSTTNNRMELMGAIEGLRKIYSLYSSQPDSVTVYSDSQYVVKGIMDWFPNKWQEEIARGKEIKNQDLWIILYDLVQLFNNIKFQWVEGHAGIEHNERCDYLAKKGKLEIKQMRK